MAVTIDLGHPTNVHPGAKRQVARRLSLWARKDVYDQTDLVCSGPLFNGTCIDEGANLRIAFDYVGGGLKAKDAGVLTGFEAAGKDGAWRPAAAAIDGNEIIVSCPTVADPQAVRYGWAPNPTVNLINTDGLPASPFRAGDFNFTAAPDDYDLNN